MADGQETDFACLMNVLQEAGVEFILVGGVAANIHGSPMGTQESMSSTAARTKTWRDSRRRSGPSIPISAAPRRVCRSISTRKR